MEEWLESMPHEGAERGVVAPPGAREPPPARVSVDRRRTALRAKPSADRIENWRAGDYVPESWHQAGGLMAGAPTGGGRGADHHHHDLFGEDTGALGGPAHIRTVAGASFIGTC